MKKAIITIWLTAVVIISLPHSVRAEDKNCLKYTPDVVAIAGTLRERTFCCEDWMLEDKGPFIYWVVELNDPVCVWAPPGVEDGLNTEYNLTEIQMVPIDIDNLYERFKHLLSKRVIVTGELFNRATGHHHTRVLMDVKNIKPLGNAK